MASEDKLPQLSIGLDIDVSRYKKFALENFQSNFIVNSFDSETFVIDVSNISELRDITIKGNIIIYSYGKLIISNTAKLHDVVIMAKDVEIKNNYSGNMQIIAKNNVVIDELAYLEYPSSIYVENDIDSVKVHFKSNSIMAGAVIVNGKTYEGSLKRQLIIDELSKIYGSVYCYGYTQLQGGVTGELYTDRFFLKTKASDYENVILNGTINGDSLPEHFVKLPIFNSNQNSKTYEIIKEF